MNQQYCVSPQPQPPPPAHSHYKKRKTRLRTFVNWPHKQGKNLSPSNLAKAGFFYTGEDDKVKCFYCDGGLHGWESDDSPWIEHARWFNRCPYVMTTMMKPSNL
nr:inhibitor of apoptosis protein 3 [Calliteara abietis nucleopolyhedrovirus]